MATPEQQAIADAAKEIYEPRRSELEAMFRGQFAVIDVLSRQVFVALSAEDAFRAAEASGGGPFFLVRIGFATAYRMRRVRVSQANHVMECA
jgi:hypothetical protein